MNKNTALVVLLALFAAMLTAFNLGTARIVASGRASGMIHRDTIVHGDGARLYSHLRSAWFDRDLDTANELRHYFNYPGSREAVEIRRTATGYAWNHTPIGCAILWSPFFLLGHAAAFELRAEGVAVAADGYSPPYAFAVALGTHFYCLLGIVLLFSICRRYYAVSSAFLAVLTVWLASFLPAYLFFYPSMSHALSFFSVCLFLRLWLATRDRGAAADWALLGLAAGLMTLVRTQNCIFLLVPLIGGADAAAGRRGGLLLAAACATAAFLPQAFAWKLTFGSWLTIPQGTGFLHWGRPAVARVLFSSRHGLFSWTPALLLGLAGFPAFIRRDRRFAAGLLAALALQTYLNSVADDWWAGTGFGARRFDNCLPLFGLGMAAVYDRLRVKGLGWLSAAAAAALIAWNGLFLCQYALNWVSHSEGIDMAAMAANQLRVPGYIIGKLAPED